MIGLAEDLDLAVLRIPLREGLAAVKVGRRKSRRSRTGSSTRPSHRTKTASSAAPARAVQRAVVLEVCAAITRSVSPPPRSKLPESGSRSPARTSARVSSAASCAPS